MPAPFLGPALLKLSFYALAVSGPQTVWKSINDLSREPKRPTLSQRCLKQSSVPKIMACSNAMARCSLLRKEPDADTTDRCSVPIYRRLEASVGQSRKAIKNSERRPAERNPMRMLGLITAGLCFPISHHGGATSLSRFWIRRHVAAI